nr:unnamed protein product [Spirometra erinaceieuropaei]
MVFAFSTDCFLHSPSAVLKPEVTTSSEAVCLNILVPQCDSSGKSKSSKAPIVYVAELPRTTASYGSRSRKQQSPQRVTSESEENETPNRNCVTVKSDCGQVSVTYNAGAVQDTGVLQAPAQPVLPTVTCTPICATPMVCAPVCYYEVPQQPMIPMMTPLPPPPPPLPPMSPSPSPPPFYRSEQRRRSRRARSPSKRRRSKSRKRESAYSLSLALHGEPGTAVSTQTETPYEPPNLNRRPPSISPKPSVSPKRPTESPPLRPIIQHKIVYQNTVPCVEDNYCVPCVPELYTEFSSDEDQPDVDARNNHLQTSGQGYEDVTDFKEDAKYGRVVRKQVCCCPAVCYCNDCYDYDSANDYCPSGYRRLRRMRSICVNRRSRAEKVLVPVEMCKECEDRQASGKPGPSRILISRN